MIKKIVFVVLFFLSEYPFAHAQTITQQLRGTLVDHQTKKPLTDVSVIIKESNLASITDSNGNFSFKKLPIGKYDLIFLKVGFQNTQMTGVELNSGKEVVLEIEMEESITTLKEVVINSIKNKDQVNNPFSLVSTRQFGPQEAVRYAGGFQDPARMALAFAGVTNSGSDDNNEIVIRGNSPRGLLWRLEGVEIPNPNHFADGQGSTSGIVSMINAYSLASSDFMTSAFPANYGNGMSGVFDLNFRRGNNQKTEFTGQISLVGLDFGIEGPLNKEGASYRVAGRYSTLSVLLNANIINLNTTNYHPNFKDVNFTIELPTKNSGRFSIWGLMGNDDTYETTTTQKNTDIGNLAVIGMSHKISFDKFYWKNILSLSTQSQENTSQNVFAGLNGLVTKQVVYTYPSLRFSSQFTYKLNPRLTFEGGIVSSLLSYKLKDNRLNSKNVLFNFLNDDGGTSYIQEYAQILGKISSKIKTTLGVHQYQFVLNNATATEPRWAIHLENNSGGVFSAGLGIHSRLEPVSVYLFKRYAADGSYTQPNKNIQPGTAIHYVASYEQKVNEKTKIKVEAYIQDLSKVPIDSAFNGTYSLLNTSGGIPTSVLQNVGFGKNKGIELTIEKFYSKNFYYLITASLFDSKYQNKNMVWHNTIYNNKYAGNILIGKEFKLKKNNAISVNVRYMLRGGNRYTPIILSESIKKAIAVLDYTQFYEAQYPDYWRTDLSVSYKKNKNKSTWSYGADIQNVTDRKNLINQTYDVANKRINDSYALPRIPILFIRCEF
ncbi:MAG: TonB-dependent receptor [Chitinophagia bacterium]|jgi:hypothetical protein|nr:TonB-dependent receptor [Chitinophagia bacterium]